MTHQQQHQHHQQQQQQPEECVITTGLIGQSNAVKIEPKRKKRVPWRTMFVLLLALCAYLTHTIYEAAKAEQEFRAQVAKEANSNG